MSRSAAELRPGGVRVDAMVYAEPSDLKSDFVGAEVSCRGMNVLFEELQKTGQPPETLLKGVSYPLGYLLTENQRIDWNSYRILLANAAKIWSDEDLVRIGGAFVHGRWASPLAIIGRLFYSTSDAYLWLAEPQTGGANLHFTCVQYTARQVRRDQLEFEYGMREGYEPCRQLHFMMKGLLTQVPTVIGSEPALVTMEERERGARYEVRIPKAARRLAKLRTLLSWPLSAATRLQELRSAHETLHVRFRELEAHIAQCKRSEDSLRAKEERYRMLTEKARDVIIETDAQGRFLYASPNLWEVLGHEPRPLSDLAGFEMLHPKDRQRVARAFAQLLATGESQRPVFRVRRSDGSLIWIESTGNVYRTQAGEVRVVLINRDVSARKQTEEELRIANERMRTLVRNAPIALVAVDRDGIVNFCDGRGLEAAGVKPNDIVGRSLLQVYRDFPGVRVRGEPDVEDYLARALAGEDFSITLEVGGHVLETRHTPMHEDSGEIAGLIGVATDVTHRVQAEEERKRLEAEIQETQKLESLGVLAGGIAHDFNNLLTSILGHAELGLQDLEEASPARAHIERIREAGRHATELTRQLLAYAGKSHVKVERVDLSRLVESMADLLRVSISKKANLDCELAANLPAIAADAPQITQIVLNLITNASEALGEDGGQIKVRTGAIELDRAELLTRSPSENLPEGSYVVLEVIDTGIGMDEETRTKIFDPFFTTKFPGRGVGLAAVRGIVRVHGGAIHVQSQPGRGTTFRVLFPVRELEEEIEGPSPTGGETWRGSGTVLVIDDEEGVRAVAEAILGRLGFEVLIASDGYDGLEMFRAHRDEVVAVLLDLTMPEMDGEKAFHELHRIGPDVPILVMSGYAEHETVARFAGSSFAGFLQKPFTVEGLQRTIRDALERKVFAKGPEVRS